MVIESSNTCTRIYFFSSSADVTTDLVPVHLVNGSVACVSFSKTAGSAGHVVPGAPVGALLRLISAFHVGPCIFSCWKITIFPPITVLSDITSPVLVVAEHMGVWFGYVVVGDD